MDVNQKIRRLQKDKITSQRTSAKMLGIARKYWEGSTSSLGTAALRARSISVNANVVSFITACLDEDAREQPKSEYAIIATRPPDLQQTGG